MYPSRFLDSRHLPLHSIPSNNHSRFWPHTQCAHTLHPPGQDDPISRTACAYHTHSELARRIHEGGSTGHNVTLSPNPDPAIRLGRFCDGSSVHASIHPSAARRPLAQFTQQQKKQPDITLPTFSKPRG